MKPLMFYFTSFEIEQTTNPRAEILFEKRVDPKYFIDPIEEY